MPKGGKITHGMTKTRFYRVYDAMTARCNNPNNNRYSIYGGRGIRCLWMTFEEFRNDMYESYLGHVDEYGEKKTQIDRIDSNKNYSKENCRWATPREQILNRRSGTVLITYKGITKHLCEWAEEIGIKRETLWARIKRGWDISRALTK